MACNVSVQVDGTIPMGSRTLTFLKGEFVGIASFTLNSQKEEVA